MCGTLRDGFHHLADPAMRKLRRELGCELYFAIFASNRASLDLWQTIPVANIYTLRADNLWLLATDTLKFLLWTGKTALIRCWILSCFSALLPCPTRLVFTASTMRVSTGGNADPPGLLQSPYPYYQEFHCVGQYTYGGAGGIALFQTYIGDEEIVLPCVSATNHSKTSCTDNACLKAISVDQVFTAVQPLLQTKP